MDRCAVHPARRAVDICPVCGRGRCGPDADAATGGGCAACRGVPSGSGHRGRPAGELELLVRSALAGFAVAVAMGFVVSEYVGAGLFAYVTPLLLGVLTGEAAQRARGTTRPPPRVRALAAGLAVAGTALGFHLEGSAALVSAQVAPSYLAAVGGALLWTVPPRRRVRAGRAG